MDKKITINEIAALAGVSKSTISRYLNGGQVSDATKETIKKIIDEHNYEPNAFAQSLRAKNSYFIGVIAPCLDSFVTSKTLMAMDEELKRLGYTSIIINTSRNLRSEVDSIGNLSRLKVDGIILVATQITEEHKKEIEKLNVPIVIVGQEMSEVHSIVNDDYKAGFAMGQYIAKKNHKDIIYLGVDSKDIAVGKNRRQGVFDGLKSCDIYNIHEYTTDFTKENSAKVTERILKNENASIIICATDNIAMGVISVLNSKGIKIPQEISVVGFGGHDISSIINPKLTTIKYKNIETGIKAANSIVNLIEDKTEPLLQKINYTFIEGESVDTKNINNTR